MPWGPVNQADSIEDPTGVYPQAQWDAVDGQILAAAVGGANGVSSGCAVTAQGSPNNTVAVASGTVVVNYVEVVVASGNVTMTAAHATLARFDLITVTNAGVKTYTVGTAAVTPVFPAIPANSVVLAAIYVDANDNVINSNQISDRRVTVPVPTAVGGWTTISRPSDGNHVSNTALINDPYLQFPMSSNTKYRIRGVLFGFQPANGGGLKIRTSGPASPTGVRTHVRIPNATTGLESSDSRQEDAYSATDIAWISPAASAIVNNLFFDMIVINGANAGTFAIKAAQINSDADASIMFAGSYLEYGVS